MKDKAKLSSIYGKCNIIISPINYGKYISLKDKQVILEEFYNGEIIFTWHNITFYQMLDIINLPYKVGLELLEHEDEEIKITKDNINRTFKYRFVGDE